MPRVRVLSFALTLDGWHHLSLRHRRHPRSVTRARQAAGGRDVRIGGGVSTVRQYLGERLIDDLHLAVRPVLLGRGESLFAGLDARALGYAVEKVVPGERATHALLKRV